MEKFGKKRTLSGPSTSRHAVMISATEKPYNFRTPLLLRHLNIVVARESAYGGGRGRFRCIALSLFSILLSMVGVSVPSGTTSPSKTTITTTIEKTTTSENYKVPPPVAKKPHKEEPRFGSPTKQVITDELRYTTVPPPQKTVIEEMRYSTTPTKRTVIEEEYR